MSALVAQADNVLAVAQGTRDALVKGLAWLGNADLLKRVQGEDQDRRHEDKRLNMR